MRKFLKENGFTKIPKRGKDVKAVYCCPDRETFVTIFENGEWCVSNADPEGLGKLELWRTKIEKHMEDMGLRATIKNEPDGNKL